MQFLPPVFSSICIWRLTLNSDTPIVTCEPARLALPESLLEMQILGFQLKPNNSEFAFYQDSQMTNVPGKVWEELL